MPCNLGIHPVAVKILSWESSNDNDLSAFTSHPLTYGARKVTRDIGQRCRSREMKLTMHEWLLTSLQTDMS